MLPEWMQYLLFPWPDALSKGADILPLALAVIALSLLGWVLVLGVVAYAAYHIVTLPLRREERARLFLSLIETGLRRGESAERTIDAAAANGPRMLGRPFYALGGCILGGMRLGEALRCVPGFLPPQVAEMLRAGEEVGDIGKVLPACQRALSDASSRVRGAINYVILLASAFFAVNVAVVAFTMVYILPRWQAMLRDMGRPLPPMLEVVASGAPSWVLTGLTGFLFLCVVFYAGGPRLVAWLHLKPLADRVAFRLPWRRKRLQRDFSAMLAVLLDAGMPEPQAVTLAARSTSNAVFVQRSKAVLRSLEQGQTLSQAVRRLDDSGEFQWRLSNASHVRTGFLRALSGWHDALEAKAFQQEQGAAHIITTAVVIFHGVVVAVVAIGIFQCLVGLIRGFVLW